MPARVQCPDCPKTCKNNRGLKIHAHSCPGRAIPTSTAPAVAVAACGPIPSEQLTEEHISPPAPETQGAPALPPPPLMSEGPTRSFLRILCPLGSLLALMILRAAAATTRRAAALPTILIARAVHTRPAVVTTLTLPAASNAA
eukprot:SM010651S14256  [mRNA]  locus=s10651:12:480:+ [translate_table: standard]